MHMSKLAVYGKIATKQIFVWSLLVYPLEVAQAQSSATESAASFLKRGDDLYEKGAIDQAIKLDPAIANAYNSRGILARLKGTSKGPTEDYSRPSGSSHNWPKPTTTGAISGESGVICMVPLRTIAALLPLTHTWPKPIATELQPEISRETSKGQSLILTRPLPDSNATPRDESSSKRATQPWPLHTTSAVRFFSGGGI